MHPHISIGAVVVGLGEVWVHYYGAGIILYRLLAVAGFIVVIAKAKEVLRTCRGLWGNCFCIARDSALQIRCESTLNKTVYKRKRENNKAKGQNLFNKDLSFSFLRAFFKEKL